MNNPQKSTEAMLEARIESLLEKMTLQEKISLLSGIDNWRTAAVERLGVPSIIMTDGPHGVRANEAGRPQSPATSFPSGVSMAASWNPALVQQVGIALAAETRALGCDVLLGPCVNIVRHPLAGRNFESYSEDPYLAGRIGVAFVHGVQSQGIGTSLKHFACNNQETERFRSNSQVDERTLREIYLAQFEMIVKEADPWTVMCSYNRLNGFHASQNDWLLNQVLRREWGFAGAVISDWGANHTTVDSVQGGLDLEMPGPAKWYGKLLAEAVEMWQIDESRIDQAARRILRLVARSGRLDGEPLLEGALNTPEHQRLARQLAEEAIVLLKNENHQLPLAAAQVRSLAVIGPMAAIGSIGGGGSSFLHPLYQVSPLEGLRARLGQTTEIHYAPGCSNVNSNKDETEDLRQAVELAQGCDAALVFVGFPAGHESEGYDRTDMELTGHQNELVQAILAANPRSVVVVNAGSPVALPWSDQAPAIVLAHYPGQEGGHAVADILLGDVNPSGKLPVTWPVKLQDTPAFVNFPGGRVVRYGEGIFVGYRYYDFKAIQPLFPFGHGLSYTEFSYQDLRAPAAAKIGDPVEISLTIANTGNRQGQEVIQLYVSDLQASLTRPSKELKGFAKVDLAPGEAREVSFTLDERAFAFYDPDRKDWVVEPGFFEIHAASSSQDIRQTVTIRLE